MGRNTPKNWVVLPQHETVERCKANLSKFTQAPTVRISHKKTREYLQPTRKFLTLQVTTREPATVETKSSTKLMIIYCNNDNNK